MRRRKRLRRRPRRALRDGCATVRDKEAKDGEADRQRDAKRKASDKISKDKTNYRLQWIVRQQAPTDVDSISS